MQPTERTTCAACGTPMEMGMEMGYGVPLCSEDCEAAFNGPADNCTDDGEPDIRLSDLDAVEERMRERGDLRPDGYSWTAEERQKRRVEQRINQLADELGIDAERVRQAIQEVTEQAA